MDMTDEVCPLGAAARARAGDMGSEMERCASDRHASCSLRAKAGSTLRAPVRNHPWCASHAWTDACPRGDWRPGSRPHRLGAYV